MAIKKININQKFESFSEHWSPKILADLNGQNVKIARLLGEFVRHKHDNEDELFFVIDGVLSIILDNETIVLNPGEFVVIPKGTYHQPIAHEEVKVMLFEPATTLNTGDSEDKTLTVNKLERLDD